MTETDLVTKFELCAEWLCSSSTVKKLISDHGIEPVAKIGRANAYSRAEIEKIDINMRDMHGKCKRCGESCTKDGDGCLCTKFRVCNRCNRVMEWEIVKEPHCRSCNSSECRWVDA